MRNATSWSDLAHSAVMYLFLLSSSRFYISLKYAILLLRYNDVADTQVYTAWGERGPCMV